MATRRGWHYRSRPGANRVALRIAFVVNIDTIQAKVGAVRDFFGSVDRFKATRIGSLPLQPSLPRHVKQPNN